MDSISDRQSSIRGQPDHFAAGSSGSDVAITPLSPLPLILSVIGIGLAALFVCCTLAVVAVVALVARVGKDGAAEFYQDLAFDGLLKTQISVFVVSALYCGAALATITAARWRGGRSWTALVALVRVRNWRDVVLIAFGTLLYAGLATYWLEHTRDLHLLVSGPTDLLLVGTIVLNLVVLAPIAEELVFRGWLYTGLRNRLGFWPSFLLTIILFAGIHFDPNHKRVVQVLPLAFALGWLRERAGSIKPTILLHGTYNLVIVGIRLVYT